MTVVGKNQRFSFLAWILVLILTGTCFSQIPGRRPRPLYQQRADQQNQQRANQQNQQPATSTADQEAQPNTANYPQRPVPAPGNPYTNPATPAPGQAVPTPSQAIQPAAQAPPQGQGFIGPPVPIPPTPEQMPPGAPKIEYQSGLLSVESFNSKLTDILNGIHSKTGIQFEGLQSGPDRVAGKFGPAPADEVLTTLLSGSRYDYVIVGLQDSPKLVQRVILSPSTTAGTVAGATGAPMGNQRANANGDDEENGSEETEAQPEQVQAPEPQQVQPVQPVVPRSNANNQPKTTEQLLEELKQIQQQNQQRQPPTAPIKPMPQ